MADVGTEAVNKTFNKRNRAWRTTIDTPHVEGDSQALLDAIRLTAHREIILVDPDTGEKYRDAAPKYQLTRTFADMAAWDAPIVDGDGNLLALPAAATEADFGVFDRGDGTYSVRLNGQIQFLAIAAMGDVVGISAEENPDNA